MIKSNGLLRLTTAAFVFCIYLGFAGTAFAAQEPLTAPAATPTSVTLNWTAPGDDGSSGTASQYDIRYSLSTITDANWTSATQVAGEPTPQTAGTAESFDVTGLTPGTTYYFAIKAADEVPNWSTLSNVVAKATEPENTPPAAIADLITLNPTTGSIALRWTAPGDDGSSGTAAQYDIRYAVSSAVIAAWDAAIQVSGEPSPQAAGAVENFTVSGLDPNTTYYFAIKTADEVPNWSSISNIANGTTSELPTAPPAPLLVSPANGATDLSQPVYVDWSDATGADLYELQVDSNVSFGSLVCDSTMTATNCDVAGLQGGDTYYWRVRAHNDVGWGDWSSVRNFSVVCPVPAVPVLASPNNNADNLTMPVTVSWAAVSGATNYHLQVDDAANFASPITNLTMSGTTYNITGLDDGVTYYWHVRAGNDCGWSAMSTSRAFTTRDTTVPSPVANLAAQPGTGNGEIKLTWTASGDDGSTGTAASYDVRYSLTAITAQNWSQASQAANEPTPQAAGSSESFTITGLNQAQVYYFALRVIDEDGNMSGLSNVVSATPADLTPPAPIMDLSAETGPLNGNISLSWTAPGDDNNSGMVSAYLIKYSSQMINSTNWDLATVYEEYVIPQPPGSRQAVVMEGLTPGERYYIGIKAYDDCLNCSDLSNVEACVAGFDIVLDIDGEDVEPVGPSPNAVLHSSHPMLAVTNITTTTDNVYYFEVAADSFFMNLTAISPPIAQMGGDITSWKVDGALQSDETYYWRAKANSNSYCATSAFMVQPSPHAYPNPFKLSETDEVRFAEVPDGANVVLMSVSGSTVRQWSNVGEDDLSWDGTNESGDMVASGTYLWFVEGTDLSGKIVLMK